MNTNGDMQYCTCPIVNSKKPTKVILYTSAARCCCLLQVTGAKQLKGGLLNPVDKWLNSMGVDQSNIQCIYWFYLTTLQLLVAPRRWSLRLHLHYSDICRSAGNSFTQYIYFCNAEQSKSSLLRKGTNEKINSSDGRHGIRLCLEFQDCARAL